MSHSSLAEHSIRPGAGVHLIEDVAAQVHEVDDELPLRHGDLRVLHQLGKVLSAQT